MNIEPAQALEMICYYAKEHLKDNKTMSQSVDIAKDIIKKELRALEIIKNKRFNVDEIYHKDYEWYMLEHKNDDAGLIPSKEEYDLVKEVML